MIWIHNLDIIKTSLLQKWISARFWPIFNFELKWKRSRAKPSWKSFSSSSDSSQLGSDSSLVPTIFSQVLQVKKGILKKGILKEALLITSLYFLLYSWSHAERSTCSSTWKYKPSKKIERGACWPTATTGGHTVKPPLS